MCHFEECSRKVIDQLAEKGTSADWLAVHERVYGAIGLWLDAESLDFDSGSLQLWLDSGQSALLTTGTAQAAARAAVKRLASVLEAGTILNENELTPWVLCDTFRETLDAYCSQTGFTSGHERRTRMWCEHFLYHMQVDGAWAPSEIRYPLLMKYAELLENSYAKTTAPLMLSSAKGLLRYMARCGMCSECLEWFVSFLARIPLAAKCLDPLPALHAGESAGIDQQTVRTAADKLLRILSERGYSVPVVGISTRALRMLQVHLNACDIFYTPEYGTEWMESMRDVFGTSWPTARRVVFQLNDLLKYGDDFEIVPFYRAPDSWPELPSWCRDAVDAFLTEREREKLAPSTLSMDRAACLRFCRFLAGTVSGFEEIDPCCVKRFNAQDVHATAAGKRAYNTRIRRFLKFLARRGLCAPDLAFALPTVHASSERLVITLTDQEKETVQDAVRHAAQPDASALEMRDTACLLLGTELGMRAVDVARLRFNDIDWSAQTIRFTQQKTGKELFVPMPVSVGNALFRYISRGRPKAATDDHIFVAHRAPFRALSVSSCKDSLQRVLPDRHVPGSRFHVTRKTFASELVRGAVPPQEVAALLGHADTTTLQPYISLDEERMSLCPLSLKELGIMPERGAMP